MGAAVGSGQCRFGALLYGAIAKPLGIGGGFADHSSTPLCADFGRIFHSCVFGIAFDVTLEARPALNLGYPT